MYKIVSFAQSEKTWTKNISSVKAKINKIKGLFGKANKLAYSE